MNFDAESFYPSISENLFHKAISFARDIDNHVIDKRFVGLYRDDGLGVLRNYSGPTFEGKWKEIISMFKGYGISITIETIIRILDFLHTTFYLMNNTYKLYRKRNDEPLYLNKHSNHPTSELLHLPKPISKRISADI